MNYCSYESEYINCLTDFLYLKNIFSQSQPNF